MAKPKSERRPNVLFIMTDQQSSSAMSCAGNDDLKTPAMDSLAETGVRFENAYCSFPLCLPCRASMFTGLMPHQMEMFGNAGSIPEERRERELGNLLRTAGYDCAYAGKWHVPEIAMPDDNAHGFDVISGFDDNALAGNCVRYLKRKHERPFFLVASFDNPHNICEWARQQSLPWGDVEDVPTEECPNLPANYAVPPYEAQALRREYSSFSAVHPTSAYSDDQWRHLRHAYFRLVEKVDGQIGRILDALRRLGLDRDTVVIFSSDHGDGHGEHHWNQKTVLYEAVTRIPLIISWPGVTKAGRAEERLASIGLDLLPTVCDYAGVTPPDDLTGRSLRKLAEGRRVREWHDDMFVETVFTTAPSGNQYQGTVGRMVRTQRYKYCVYSWGLYREQLFDLETDPGEMVNLAVEARYSDVLRDMRRRLDRWGKRTNDPVVLHPGGRKRSR